MVVVAWCLSRATLYGYHECALSQADAHPDMTLDVARTKTNKYNACIHDGSWRMRMPV